MNWTNRFANGQFFTAGEKALVVMLVAGFFGYWAGFNLSGPGVGVSLSMASASSMAVAPEMVVVVPTPPAFEPTLD